MGDENAWRSGIVIKKRPPPWPGAKIPVSTATATSVGASSLRHNNSIRTIFPSRRRQFPVFNCVLSYYRANGYRTHGMYYIFTRAQRLIIISLPVSTIPFQYDNDAVSVRNIFTIVLHKYCTYGYNTTTTGRYTDCVTRYRYAKKMRTIRRGFPAPRDRRVRLRANDFFWPAEILTANVSLLDHTLHTPPPHQTVVPDVYRRSTRLQPLRTGPYPVGGGEQPTPSRSPRFTCSGDS